jgi:Xaa-Pro aminopeptidase
MTDCRPLAPPDLPTRLRPIIEAPYPRFSTDEMARRHAAVAQAMEAAGVAHLLIYGAQRVGGIIQYLTQWPITAEAAGVVSPGTRDALFIQFYNHLPLAKRLAEADVESGGDSCVARALETLARRGAKRDTVGVIGPLGFKPHAELAVRYGRIVDLNPSYTRLRTIKSAAELDWLRIGAHLSDLAISALRRELRPGLSERELGAIVETAYLPFGGQNQIHYFGVTSMAAPDVFVPAQFPSTRRIVAGDIVFAEISAGFWDYSGQVLRSFAVGAEPPPLYRDLHDTADRAFDAISSVLRAGATPAEVVTASGAIEQAGFTTCDDLLHGYGGGYLPPMLGSASRPAGPLPAMTFAAGMTVVIQPNVIAIDRKAGVQTGELVLVTETGIERLHNAERGFLRV